MALMPAIEPSILRAIWAAWEGNAEQWDSIGISMSDLGSDCDRQIWNSYRWVSKPEKLTGRKLRLFRTGHIEEERMIADLRMVEGVVVYDTDPDRLGRDGKPSQWKVYSHGGHVRGKLDGKVQGLPEAPKTMHVLECKSHNDKNFKELKKKKLKAAKISHWYQCQKYMQLVNLTRCLYMAVNKNDDDLYVERIEYDPVAILQMDGRLERIIKSNRAPPRIAADSGKYPCMICKHKDACHDGAFGRENCRTCVHSTPIVVEGTNDATWLCEKFNRTLSVDEQRAGCHAHLFLPDVVPGEQVDAGDDFVAYDMRDGSRWVNQEKKAPAEPVCETCGGSKVEMIDAGHGNVIDAPCSMCSVCGEKQSDTPSGMTCANGHGGAEPLAHDLYKTGDKDTPNEVKDRNGHVVLDLCRRCGRGERELRENNGFCVPSPRYWWKPSTQELWSTEFASHESGGSDGDIEELTADDYLSAKQFFEAQAYEQTAALDAAESALEKAGIPT